MKLEPQAVTPHLETGKSDQGPCLVQLFQLMTEGVFPNEQRLESLMDRIEGTP